MDTYVVRIYRPPKRTSRLVLGIVEKVGTNGFTRFSTFDELREILTRVKPSRRAAPPQERDIGAGA